MVLRENLIFYGIAGILFAIAIIIMLATHKLKINTIPSLFVALSNGYGLVLLCIAFGYGFVELPRRLWLTADPGYGYRIKLNQMYKEINLCAESVANADASLDIYRIAEENINHDMISKFISLCKNKADRINLLKSSLPIPDKYYSSQPTNKMINVVRKTDWSTCTLSNIEDFLCLLDQTAEALDQCKNFVLATSKQAERALYDYKSSFSNKIKPKITKIFKKILSIILIVIFGIICCWGEVTLVFSKPQINLLYAITNSGIPIGTKQALFTFPYISFLLFIGGWTLINARVGSFYRFIPHATNANTLNYWAVLICRLGPTIGYHYLLQIGVPKTSFGEVMGIMDDVSFIGDYWNYLSPILMIIVGIFVGFNLWAKIKNCCSCFGNYLDTFTNEEEKNIQLGEEVLKELSIDASNWIEENPRLSVSSILKSYESELKEFDTVDI